MISLFKWVCQTFVFTGYGSVSQSSRELDRAARKDLNMERRRAKMADQERSEKELEKAGRLAKQRELAKSLVETLKYRPNAWNVDCQYFAYNLSPRRGAGNLRCFCKNFERKGHHVNLCIFVPSLWTLSTRRLGSKFTLWMRCDYEGTAELKHWFRCSWKYRMPSIKSPKPSHWRPKMLARVAPLLFENHSISVLMLSASSRTNQQMNTLLKMLYICALSWWTFKKAKFKSFVGSSSFEISGCQNCDLILFRKCILLLCCCSYDFTLRPSNLSRFWIGVKFS